MDRDDPRQRQKRNHEPKVFIPVDQLQLRRADAIANMALAIFVHGDIQYGSTDNAIQKATEIYDKTHPRDE